ncbi:glycoside hydrolase family 16 protein [Undibacterium sp. JH2W]|uniref:glycoside hydrolase family 16 protein n=1 Tax=Undibacterium sp. JH2W TaxID=3413037 RepID=UPI003BF0A03F
MKKQISLPACLTYLSLLLLTACGGSNSMVQTQVTPSLQQGWELVWADEFAADKLDTQSWQIETGGQGWGNHELENYTARKENLRLENGMLVIEARKEKYGDNDYTSARIKTAGLREFTYGRFEARIKIPAGQGIWPAFWLLGTDISAVGWPERGEIDIMENIGKEAATTYGTLHGPGYYGATGFGGSKKLAQGKLADDFHIYAVEWDAAQIRWYLDGNLYHQASPASIPGKWVFDHEFFIILNLAIGGDWPGAPDASTSFPQQMLVDYVRVYKRKT